jgi:hypothetical protein
MTGESGFIDGSGVEDSIFILILSVVKKSNH